MPAGDDSLLEVGRIVKAHGIRGEVAVVLTSDRPERTVPGAVLHTDRGPLTVRSSRPHQSGYVIAFEGVADRTHLKVGQKIAASYEEPQEFNPALGYDIIEVTVTP